MRSTNNANRPPTKRRANAVSLVRSEKDVVLVSIKPGINIPERREAVANVSDHSRSIARIPIGRQVEQLQSERESLSVKKRQLELALAELSGWKKGETAKLLSRNPTKDQAIEATMRFEAEVIAKRSPIVREINAIDERLLEIKRRLRVESSSGSREPREDVEILRRIEKLLIVLVERSQAKMDFTGEEM